MSLVIGHLRNFPDNQFRIVEVNGRSIGVFRRGNEFYALRNVCPHKGGPLCRGTVSGSVVPSDPDSYVYEDDQLVVRCPWHGWEFSLQSGKGQFGAANLRVASYAVRLEGDSVVFESRSRAKSPRGNEG